MNGFSRTPSGEVVLTMTDTDYDMLLIVLGIAYGWTSQHGDLRMRDSFLALTNRINTGNPDYTPYTLSNEKL